MTLVEGGSCRGQQLAGIQVHAISGAAVEISRNGNGGQTTSWQDGRARHCVLTTAGPGGAAGKIRAEQAAGAFEQWQEELSARGGNMKDVARTWFYLDDILNWYGDFNRVRNDFFARCELRAGHVPASTGVSGRNPNRTALAAVAWALQPHDPDTRAFDFVASPRQCPAPSYGSAFSRAVEIHSAGFRQLLVSGTASIAPDGKTAHGGDVARQIELSLQVVNDILASRAMSFADVSRATAYFATPEDVAVWERWQTAHGLQQMPVVCACCDICRDDLMFEIELDALKSDGR
jgi:enamine deaminase RidA (YjgF/YER057c/UK114 family)